MEILFILFITSTSILAILWSIMLQQLCMTSIKNTQTLRSSGFAFTLCTFGLIMNIVYHLHKLYPQYILFAHFKVTDLRHFLEIIGILLGTHIYRIFLTTLFDRLYRPMGQQYPQPIFIKYTPKLLHMIIILAAIACFLSSYLLHDSTYK